MTYQYSFKDLLGRAERITWRVEDLVGGKSLDFGRPFMPESLARTTPLDFLNGKERRTLNQIGGHTYLSIFGIVEEFILPFVLDHARPFLNGEDYHARALLEFASEEAKHIHLFRAFQTLFAAGFRTPCEVIGPAKAIGDHVLSHHPLSVALLILQIEWMTQRHYQDSVEGDPDLDPLFKSLLLHHWMEEHQHAQLDALMVETLAAEMSRADVDAAIDGYLALGGFFDEGLRQQAAFDMAAFEAATGRTLSDDQRVQFLAQRHQASRWTYIGSGMTHPKFLETIGRLNPSRVSMLKDTAVAFS